MRGVRPGWRWPGALASLQALLLLAGCQTSAPASPTRPVELGPAAATGKQLFLAKGCVACHRAPGVPEAVGTIGPDLRGIGNAAAHPKIAGVIDNTPDNMQRWIKDPPAMKPGTAMPSLGLSDDEAANLTAFLETLR